MTRSTGRVRPTGRLGEPPLRAGMDLTGFPRMTETAELYTSSTEYVFASSFEIGLDAVLDAIAGFAARFRDRSTP